jgi:hypothetical protein
MLAYMISWGAGEVVDWSTGVQPESQVSPDVSQLLKSLEQSQR